MDVECANCGKTIHDVHPLDRDIVCPYCGAELEVETPSEEDV
jgi:DNA-directed RNA polymerase subunit RPC12/RpoP